MTSDRFDNTMRDWLADRGAGRAPDGLHLDAMTLIGARRQRVGWWATLRAGAIDGPTIRGVQAGAAARTFAVLVLTLILGVALGFAVASRPAVLPTPTQSPQPTPTQSIQPTPTNTAPFAFTSEFIQPFEYSIPSADPQWITDVPELYGFVDSREGLPQRGYGPMQASSPRGIAVMPVDQLWIHRCDVPTGDGEQRMQMRTNAQGLLEELDARSGLAFGPITPTQIDERPALSTRLLTESSACTADLWFDEGSAGFAQHFVATSVPSQFFVVELGERTILIDVWAQSAAELEAWLPIASEFVDSIHFIDEGDSSPTRVVDFLRPFSFIETPGENFPWKVTNLFFQLADTLQPGRASHGMTVAAIVQPTVHECGGSGGRIPLRIAPAELLEDLETVAGVALTDPTPTTLGGYVALMTTRAEGSNSCGTDLHVDGRGISSPSFTLADSAQTIVADVDGLTVFVDMWATTDAELADWLPVGMEIVNSIHFIEQ